MKENVSEKDLLESIENNAVDLGLKKEDVIKAVETVVNYKQSDYRKCVVSYNEAYKGLKDDFNKGMEIPIYKTINDEYVNCLKEASSAIEKGEEKSNEAIYLAVTKVMTDMSKNDVNLLEIAMKNDPIVQERNQEQEK